MAPAPLKYPAAAHRWGGNMQFAMDTMDLVWAYDPSQGNPNTSRAGGNPNLVAVTIVSLHPGTGHSTHYTYGVDLVNFTGVTDNLSPNAQGSIRAYNHSVDDGYLNLGDGGIGFKLDNGTGAGSTPDLIKKALYYAWKQQGCASKGYDGYAGDNWVWYSLVLADWFYGPGWPGNGTAWNAGINSITTYLKAQTGAPLIGGNVSYRTSDPTNQASHNFSLYETLQDVVGTGSAKANAFAAKLAEVRAWQNAGGGRTTWLQIKHNVAYADAANRRRGLALSCILRGAYMPMNNADDNDVSQPAEMLYQGQRNYLGLPVGVETRSGNTFTQNFQFGNVSYNFDNGVATFNVTGGGGTEPSNLTIPAIGGSPVNGSTLTSDPGTWDQSPTSYNFTWAHYAANGTTRIGTLQGPTNVADGGSYPPLTVSTTVGDRIKLEVTAVNAIGTSSVAISNPTVPVTDAPPPPPYVKYFLTSAEVSTIQGNLGIAPYAGAWANEQAYADSQLSHSPAAPNPNQSFTTDNEWQTKLYQPGFADGSAAHSLAFAYLMTGTTSYANRAALILRNWRDVYTHPPGHGGGTEPGHYVAEALGFGIKSFMAINMLVDYFSESEYATFSTWAAQWIAIGKANADYSKDHPWDVDTVISGKHYNWAWAGNSMAGQMAMAGWAAAVAGSTELTSFLDWLVSHTTSGGNQFGWDVVLDGMIIRDSHSTGGLHSGSASPGECVEGHVRRSLFYGLFGWADLVVLADLAKHADYPIDFYTRTSSNGANLANIAQFYSPYIQHADATSIQTFYNLFTGDGAANPDPSQWRSIWEFVRNNIPTSHARYNDVSNAVLYGGNSQREDNYHTHIYRYTPQIISAAVTASAPPASITPPVVTGVAQQGEILTTTVGTWTNLPDTYTIYWQRINADGVTFEATLQQETISDTDIPATYTIQAADVGHRINTKVQADNSDGFAQSSSAVTSIVQGVAPSSLTIPTISGTAQSGSVLTMTPGTWSGSPTTYSIFWQRFSQDLSIFQGTTQSETIPVANTPATYTAQLTDVGHRIKVKVQADNSYGSAQITSNPTATIVGPPAWIVLPIISGVSSQGSILTTTVGVWTDSPPPETYEIWWQKFAANGITFESTLQNEIIQAGGTPSTYRPLPSDVGHTIKVKVEAFNQYGSAQSTSIPTGIILVSSYELPAQIRRKFG